MVLKPRKAFEEALSIMREGGSELDSQAIGNLLRAKAERAISEGHKLTRSKKDKDRVRGHELIAAGQLVLELWHQVDAREFEERAKALFLTIRFV
jgi:hypothetical protein